MWMLKFIHIHLLTLQNKRMIHLGTLFSSSPTSCTPGPILNQPSFALLSICSPTCTGGFAMNGGSKLPASTTGSFSLLSGFARTNFGSELWAASSRFLVSSWRFSSSFLSSSRISGIGNTPIGSLTFGLCGDGALSRDGDTRLPLFALATVEEFPVFRELAASCTRFWKKETGKIFFTIIYGSIRSLATGDVNTNYSNNCSAKICRCRR